MKNVLELPLLLLLFGLLASSCDQCKEKTPRLPGDFNYLNGSWVAEGYQCPDHPVGQEKINITWTAASGIVALKTVGDDCVPAGYVTFRGPYDSANKRFNITWTTGNFSSPGCCTVAGTLIVIDDNTLEGRVGSSGEVVTFTR